MKSSERKNVKKVPVKTKQKTSPVKAQKKVRKPLWERWRMLPVFCLVFLLIWFFAGIVYGDVFYMAEQNTYLAFNKTIMQNVLDFNNGWVILMGRYFLLSFHYPLFGGFVLALILTLTAWLLDYVLRLRGYAHIISAVLPLLYVIFLVYLGLNLFYQTDPYFIFAYPVLLLVVLLIAAIIVRLVSRRSVTWPWKTGMDETKQSNMGTVSAVLLVFVALLVYAIPFHVNTRVTVKMQRLMEKSDWDAMIDLAKTVKQPSRSVCCYYAIALSQTDRLGSELFNIRFQYPNMHLRNRSGNPDSGTEYYAADGDFYAGLINTSYHECMERSVIDGPNVQRLKRLYFCSLLNGEKFLAHKYLNLIGHMPFEQDFIDEFGPLLYDDELLRNDPELSKVAELIPAEDAFEQWFRTPLFIGYNVLLTSGRSIRALKNSLAACLYAKELGNFFDRTQPIRGNFLEKSFEEGAVLYGLKDKEKLQLFQTSPMAMQNVKLFLNDVVQYKGTNRKKVALKLNDTYLGYYPFYYYFENIPDENYVFNKKKSDGVN